MSKEVKIAELELVISVSKELLRSNETAFLELESLLKKKIQQIKEQE